MGTDKKTATQKKEDGRMWRHKDVYWLERLAWTAYLQNRVCGTMQQLFGLLLLLDEEMLEQGPSSQGGTQRPNAYVHMM